MINNYTTNIRVLYSSVAKKSAKVMLKFYINFFKLISL